MSHPGSALAKMLVSHGAREVAPEKNGRVFLELSGKRFSITTEGRIPSDVVSRLNAKARSAIRIAQRQHAKNKPAVPPESLVVSGGKRMPEVATAEIPGLVFEDRSVAPNEPREIQHRVHGAKRLAAVLEIMRSKPTQHWSMQVLAEALPAHLCVSGLNAAVRALPSLLKKCTDVVLYKEGPYNYVYLKDSSVSSGAQTPSVPYSLPVFESEEHVVMPTPKLPEYLQADLDQLIKVPDPYLVWVFIGRLSEWLRASS